MPSDVTRVLVIHPEAATRQAVESAVRAASRGAASIYQAASMGAGLESARRLAPRAVFLDVGAERELALELARGLRGAGRVLVGLYNPLVHSADDVEFLREAARAGIADFVPLPPSEVEVAEVLAAALGRGEGPVEGRVVTFFGHKGGAGRTTLAVNTALVLSAGEQTRGEVVLCDAALQFGGAAEQLGLAPQHDLAELTSDLADPAALAGYITLHPVSMLRVLASPRDPVAADGVTPEQMSRVLIALRRRFDMVVVDTSPGLDLLSLAILDLSEKILVVTDSLAPTVVATGRFLALLEAQGFGPDRVGVVVNAYEAGAGLGEGLIAEQLGREPEIIVPFERQVRGSIHRGEPLVLTHGSSAFAERIGELAERVAAAAPAGR